VTAPQTERTPSSGRSPKSSRAFLPAIATTAITRLAWQEKLPTSYVDDNAKSPLERHRAKLAGRNSGAHRQPMATEGTRYLGQMHRMEVTMHALETIETQAR